MIDERCTTNDDGQKQIHVAIGHTSDSGGLKKLALYSLNSKSNNLDKKVKGRKTKWFTFLLKTKFIMKTYLSDEYRTRYLNHYRCCCGQFLDAADSESKPHGAATAGVSHEPSPELPSLDGFFLSK